jgi:hypothetical protein
VSRIRKKTFYLQFCMETPEAHQESIFKTSKMKKNKDTYGIYPTEFADSTQNPKKLSEHQNHTLKKKRSQKFV